MRATIVATTRRARTGQFIGGDMFGVARFSPLLPLALTASLVSCAPARNHATRDLPRGPRELSRDEQVAHVLSRLTFGARPGDAERVSAMGVDKWIAAQLRPETIRDSALAAVLAPLPSWSQSTTSLLTPPPVPAGATPPLMVRTVNGQVVQSTVIRFTALPNDQFFAGKIIRAETSERQLEEVVADFWENHFSVFSGKTPSREALIVWDRDVLRPRVLGNFRDLLGAVAHSPMMLFYLDNVNSRKRAINENYARELLELHTLGVDGGYTQQDIIAVAKALTGWTLAPVNPANPLQGPGRPFLFNASMHDSSEKVVLGHTLAAGRGIEDGEQVLDIIAQHPSTARFIAWKLARRFVSDTPPVALVNRAAATFTRTNGDIRETLRTIVTSPEFFSRAALRAKVKTPFELVVSVRRALNLPVDTTSRTVRLVAGLGQPMFGRQSPEGWPDDGGSWVNTGTILQRMRIASQMFPGAQARAMETWSGWAPLLNAPVEQQVAGTVQMLLGGIATPSTREVLLATSGEPAQRLREILVLALGSPEFQRR